MADDSGFDPTSVNLDAADPTDIICYLNAGGNDYDGRLGARISALFVILVVSTAATLFPVLATRVKHLHVPLYVYLFARYFGSGVIIATAFIHLLDPAYDEIGPASCVGMTGGWAEYSWPAGITLTSVMVIFLFDFLADWYVERKYGKILPEHGASGALPASSAEHGNVEGYHSDVSIHEEKTQQAFRKQIAAFGILEFGVIFHSVIIGLNLGVVGEEFNTLYPVLVFHQSFEGLGIGARLSSIPFPRHLRWLPWFLCIAYGLTTPIAIAIGLGLRTTYDSGSFTANVVSGILDSISAGILIYTGLVEMLAKDFIFDPERTKDSKRIAFMLVSLYLGAIIMALLGKWA
ncbi:putative Zinc/iron permease [Seiridium cardinale]|uniref:Zinc/iron permease n=1 Tax=Seiridium cardinale TaxID=138064 RepID=A0ABR2X8E1_9PEZI